MLLSCFPISTPPILAPPPALSSVVLAHPSSIEPRTRDLCSHQPHKATSPGHRTLCELYGCIGTLPGAVWTFRVFLCCREQCSWDFEPDGSGKERVCVNERMSVCVCMCMCVCLSASCAPAYPPPNLRRLGLLLSTTSRGRLPTFSVRVSVSSGLGRSDEFERLDPCPPSEREWPWFYL